MYIVMEAQTTGDQVATLIYKYDTINEAESKYHTILAAAAVSSVPKHGAVILQDDCVPVMWYCYDHTETPTE